MPSSTPARTLILTLLTLLAFAGNSILARLALADGAIDPLSFTALRLCSGALILLPFLRRPADVAQPWNPLSALALLAYALPFSLAYLSLDTGVGALLLFGSVQVTMLAAGFLRGERLGLPQAFGWLLALAGFLVLVRPGLAAPDPIGALLMALAGLAWGLYSLIGRGVSAPRLATARNFLLAAPVALLVLALAHLNSPIALPAPRGIGLAIASGALTSGLGYVLWYAALRGHSRSSAALVQLAVPLIAAAGGMLLLGEAPSLRFGLAATLTLGGIGLAIVGGGGALHGSRTDLRSRAE
jgi:drug/metabolite transporter (DMT)-like permease